mgnify:CR=1 FL=1
MHTYWLRGLWFIGLGFARKSWIGNGCGVEEFFSFAKSHTQDDKIRCPCQVCGNHRSHSIDDVRGHLRAYGIICSYQTWYLHGEDFVHIKRTSTSTKGKEPIVEENIVDENVGDNMYNMIND